MTSNEADRTVPADTTVPADSTGYVVTPQPPADLYLPPLPEGPRTPAPPADRPRPSRLKTIGIGAGLFVAAAVATGGIVTATDHSSAGGGNTAGTAGGQGSGVQGPGGQFDGQGPGGQNDGQQPDGQFDGHRRGGGFGDPDDDQVRIGAGNALHGQFVVANSGGGYVTMEIQTGKVTAASATSVTVASTDGYTHSYTMGSSTVVAGGTGTTGQVTTGHTVTVEATVSGQTETATRILDRSVQQQSGSSRPWTPSWPTPSTGLTGRSVRARRVIRRTGSGRRATRSATAARRPARCSSASSTAR